MRMPMRLSKSLALSLSLSCCVLASAKKKKPILPDDVLQARTVYVMVDPQAGMSMDDPNANYIARQEVERSILSWGRFTLAPDIASADLVIVVRKGSERPVDGTIGGPASNNNPVMTGRSRANPSMDTDPSDPVSRQPTATGDPTSPQPNTPVYPSAYPQIEAGHVDDTMAVYRGKRGDALDAPSVWRITAKNALQSPGVPAVDDFRKTIADAEKQQQQQQQANHP